MKFQLSNDKSINKMIAMLCLSLLVFLSIGVFVDEVNSISNQVIYVGGENPESFSTISEAIQSASDGDTIVVYSGVYKEQLFITKPLSIIAAEGSTPIIDGDQLGDVIQVLSDDVVIDGFTVKNSTIDKNMTASFHAGCFILADNVSILNGVFLHNHIGISVNDSSLLRIENCVFENNLGGIRLYNVSNSDIDSVTISDHELFAASCSEMSNVVVSYCNFSNIPALAMALTGSSGNIFHHNMYYNNTIAIRLFQSRLDTKGNVFYSNNFMNNDMNVNDCCNNTWDYNGVGNYWDDYTGTDADEDGIGDTSYEIPLVSKDRYPHMIPFDLSAVPQISIVMTQPISIITVDNTISLKGTVETQSETITQLAIRIDDGEWTNITPLKTWNKTVNTSNLSEGTHEITVYGEDTEGNSAMTSVSFIVQHGLKDPSDEDEPSNTPAIGLVGLVVLVLFVALCYRRSW